MHLEIEGKNVYIFYSIVVKKVSNLFFVRILTIPEIIMQINFIRITINMNAKISDLFLKINKLNLILLNCQL